MNLCSPTLGLSRLLLSLCWNQISVLLPAERVPPKKYTSVIEMFDSPFGTWEVKFHPSAPLAVEGKHTVDQLMDGIIHGWGLNAHWALKEKHSKTCKHFE